MVKLLLETLAVAGAEQWWSVAVIPVVVEDLLVEDVVVEDLLVVPLPLADLMPEMLTATTAEQLWLYVEGIPIPMVAEDEEEEEGWSSFFVMVMAVVELLLEMVVVAVVELNRHHHHHHQFKNTRCNASGSHMRGLWRDDKTSVQN